MNWYLTREKSKTLFGPSPITLIEPISKEEFIQSVKDNARSWGKWVEGMKNRYAQSYAILSMCRALFSYKKGDQASKKEAAEWAQRELPEWSTLIQNAIDWKEAGIHVCGKGHRQSRLPLTQEVGNAVAAYLQNGRPRTDTDTLFIRSRAPFRGFTSHCAVSVIVAQAMRRSGVSCPSRGSAHVLRHSVATSLLRQGTPLQDIAAILRHRSIETTQIYAKVDVTTLRQIVQAWPEVQPC